MEADAFLVLGAAETVVGISDRFRPHPEHRGLYVPSTQAMLQRVNSNVIPLVPRVAASRI
jgi:chemotaxis protein methyltransferase CheR